MKNIYLYGFVGELGNVLKDELVHHYNLVGWLSDTEEATENIWEFLFGIVSVDKIHSQALNDYENFYNQYFMKFLFMVMRRGLYWKDIHSIRNEFSIIYYKVYQILIEKDVEVIIFPNLPHEGPDYIFYNVAKELNIRTIIFHQSIFPNKIFVTTSLNDFGNFRNIPPLFSNKIVIEEGFKQKIFYMQQFEEQLANRKRNIIQKTIKNFWNRYNKLKLKFKNLLTYKKEKNIIKNVTLKIIKKIENYNYHLNLQAHSCMIEDIEPLGHISTKVIYVPLHLQPELSTVTLGELYEDQMTMIETLSLKLGEQGVILVKENPYQDAFQRSRNFFERIKSLKNVYLVDINYPSSELLEKSDIVATISGTAGWEAIKGGKRCLLFGNSWYQRLPGCFKYTSDMDLNRFIEENYEFDFNKFQDKFSNLMNTCADGIVDKDYIVEVENFTYEQNAKSIVSSLNKIILNKKVVW
jgi:hypothetical protein